MVQNRSAASFAAYEDHWPLDWTASLLAQIEQSALYNALNWSHAGGNGSNPFNSTVMHTRVSTMMCPSEDAKVPTVAAGWKNYLANIGGPSVISAWNGSIVPLRSDPGDNPGYSSAGGRQNSNCVSFGVEAMTDGTSNTALFSETLIGSGFPADRVTIANAPRKSTYLFPSGLTLQPDQGPNGGPAAEQFLQTCRSLPGTTAGYGGLAPANGNLWIAGHAGSTLMWDAYNHWLTPNSPGCYNGADGNTGAWGAVENGMPPSSNHPGGVNLAFADGSVRFIKDTIAAPTWWALGTRNGGEVVSSDSY